MSLSGKSAETTFPLYLLAVNDRRTVQFVIAGCRGDQV